MKNKIDALLVDLEDPAAGAPAAVPDIFVPGPLSSQDFTEVKDGAPAAVAATSEASETSVDQS